MSLRQGISAHMTPYIGHAGAQPFADIIKQAVKTEYGHLARAFLAAFIQRRESLEADVRRFLDTSLPRLCPDDADGQVKRVARRFLLCAAAGEMAMKLGLLPWEHGTALAATETWVVSRIFRTFCSSQSVSVLALP